MRAIRGRRLKSQQELVVFYGYVGLPEGYHQSSEISSKATILSTWGCMYFIVFLFPPKSQFYGLSFVIMFPIQIDIMAIPYARVFF